MSTDTTANGDEAAAASESTDENAEVNTLRDISDGPGCEVFVGASVRVYRDIFSTVDGEIVNGDFNRPAWETLETDTYHCRGCGQEFDTEEEAVEHVTRQYRWWKMAYRLPEIDSDQPSSVESARLSFEEPETITLADITITVRKDKFNRAALVEDGIDGLLATTRRQYELPADYAFGSWEPAADGSLTGPDDDARFNPRDLAGALAYLARDPEDYDPDAFTLFDRGKEPFLLTGYGQAILLPPTI